MNKTLGFNLRKTNPTAAAFKNSSKAQILNFCIKKVSWAKLRNGQELLRNIVNLFGNNSAGAKDANIYPKNPHFIRSIRTNGRNYPRNKYVHMWLSSKENLGKN